MIIWYLLYHQAVRVFKKKRISTFNWPPDWASYILSPRQIRIIFRNGSFSSSSSNTAWFIFPNFTRGAGNFWFRRDMCGEEFLTKKEWMNFEWIWIVPSSKMRAYQVSIHSFIHRYAYIHVRKHNVTCKHKLCISTYVSRRTRKWSLIRTARELF